MENVEIARRFSEKVIEKFKDFVKSIVLFGSSVREKEARDIDILIIVDDTLLPWTSQTFSMMFEGIGEILEDFEERERIHPNVLVLSAFISNVIKGEPITLNIIRDGTVLYDTGFFMPIKRLLSIGRIKPSTEATVSTYKRSLLSLGRAKWRLLMSLVDIYWAMMLSAEALLMHNGIIPGSPTEIPNQLENLLDEKYRNWLKEIYKIQKDIAKFEKKETNPKEMEEWMRRADEFLREVDKKIKETYKSQ